MKQKNKIKQLMGTALAAITAFVMAAGINGNITTVTKASEVKEGESTQAPTENEDVQAPQTSDNSAVVMISLLAVVSLMGMVVFGKKRVL